MQIFLWTRKYWISDVRNIRIAAQTALSRLLISTKNGPCVTELPIQFPTRSTLHFYRGGSHSTLTAHIVVAVVLYHTCDFVSTAQTCIIRARFKN